MTEKHWLRGWLTSLFASVCLLNAAFAQAPGDSPPKALSQYVHDVWNTDKGFLGGTVYAICQSRDGYLWIGTERGLVRFNGFDFTLIQRPVPGMPPIGAVRGLAADVEGNLWVRLDGPRLLLYRNGKFVDAADRFGLHEVAFTAMALDTQGELILWGLKNQTLRYSKGAFRRYAGSANIAGVVIAAAETRDHRVWLGTRNIGLFHIDRDHMAGMSSKLTLTSVNALLPVNESGLWIGTDTGLSLWNGTRMAAVQIPSSMNQLQILALTSDHSGNVWAGTAHGLVRITPAHLVSTELLSRSTPQKSHASMWIVMAIFGTGGRKVSRGCGRACLRNTRLSRACRRTTTARFIRMRKGEHGLLRRRVASIG